MFSGSNFVLLYKTISSFLLTFFQSSVLFWAQSISFCLLYWHVSPFGIPGTQQVKHTAQRICCSDLWGTLSERAESLSEKYVFGLSEGGSPKISTSIIICYTAHGHMECRLRNKSIFIGKSCRPYINQSPVCKTVHRLLSLGANAACPAELPIWMFFVTYSCLRLSTVFDSWFV